MRRRRNLAPLLAARPPGLSGFTLRSAAETLVAARLYDSDGNALFDSDGNALWVMVPE